VEFVRLDPTVQPPPSGAAGAVGGAVTAGGFVGGGFVGPGGCVTGVVAWMGGTVGPTVVPPPPVPPPGVVDWGMLDSAGPVPGTVGLVVF